MERESFSSLPPLQKTRTVRLERTASHAHAAAPALTRSTTAATLSPSKSMRHLEGATTHRSLAPSATSRTLAPSVSAPELPQPQVVEDDYFKPRPSYLGALEKRSYLRKVVRSLEDRSLRPELREMRPRMGREEMRTTAKSHSLEIYRRFQMTRVAQRLKRLDFAEIEKEFRQHADSTGRLTFPAMVRFLDACGISRDDFAPEFFRFLKTPGASAVRLQELRLGMAALLHGEVQAELHAIFAKLPSGLATKEELKELFLQQISPYSRTIKHFLHEADRQAGEIIVYADSNSDGKVSVADVMYEGVGNPPFLRMLTKALHIGKRPGAPAEPDPAARPASRLDGARSPSPPLPGRRGLSSPAPRAASPSR
eukprot:tig00001629_g9522.t1